MKLFAKVDAAFKISAIKCKLSIAFWYDNVQNPTLCFVVMFPNVVYIQVIPVIEETDAISLARFVSIDLWTRMMRQRFYWCVIDVSYIPCYKMLIQIVTCTSTSFLIIIKKNLHPCDISSALWKLRMLYPCLVSIVKKASIIRFAS